MPYADTAKRHRATAEWAKTHRVESRAHWRKSAKKRRGEPGSPEREAYNEQRRAKYKAPVLAELEASRKHRESLREFITRKAA